MAVDDDKKDDPAEPQDAPAEPQDPPEEETAPDPRDERIAALEAQLADANNRADAAGQALFAMRVSNLDLLADPTSMAYDPTLTDDAALQAAVLALIATDPALGKLKVSGDIGQDASETPGDPPMPTLLDLMKLI